MKIFATSGRIISMENILVGKVFGFIVVYLRNQNFWNIHESVWSATLYVCIFHETCVTPQIVTHPESSPPVGTILFPGIAISPRRLWWYVVSQTKKKIR